MSMCMINIIYRGKRVAAFSVVTTILVIAADRVLVGRDIRIVFLLTGRFIINMSSSSSSSIRCVGFEDAVHFVLAPRLHLWMARQLVDGPHEAGGGTLVRLEEEGAQVVPQLRAGQLAPRSSSSSSSSSTGSGSTSSTSGSTSGSVPAFAASEQHIQQVLGGAW
eukprot:CAMPEP_0175016878 /NCGR_PEP_ID=MMETSP0005-20121125/12069_1 /TAXON_ID=420556 /ORGANISM="Ochromonas sp., Strain CCMP1393" /LENGTH=163 /DNA_ID=CAMNT_0016274195 /DNA_START=1321 /DNA_END=1809 /DNA_ORIENTATION=-